MLDHPERGLFPAGEGARMDAFRLDGPVGDSAAALPRGFEAGPMDGAMPLSPTVLPMGGDAYWLPGPNDGGGPSPGPRAPSAGIASGAAGSRPSSDMPSHGVTEAARLRFFLPPKAAIPPGRRGGAAGTAASARTAPPIRPF